MAYQNAGTGSDFETLNSNISSNIYKIRQNTNQFLQLGKFIGTSKDNQTVRANIQKLFKNTNQIIQQTGSSLRHLSRLPGNESEMTFAKSKRAFEGEIANYSRLQKELDDKLRRTQLLSEQDAMNNDQTGVSSSSSSLLQQEQKQLLLPDLDNRLDMIRDREIKIKQVESDVLDINEIMRELGGMVHEQASLVDNITSNVDNTNDQVLAANTQLIQANKYLSKSRKKMLILILIVMIVMLTLGLIIYMSIRRWDG